MKVEIGALVEKKYGHLVKDQISQLEGVDYVFYATGRSNDLFEQRQFGDFGEAAIITIIVDESQKIEVFEQLFEICQLQNRKSGVVFMSNAIIKTN
jgi:hypothetical protein